MKKLSLSKAAVKTIACVAAAAVAVTAAGLTAWSIHKKVPVKPSQTEEIYNIDTHQQGILRVGIISDTQLPPNKKLEEKQDAKYKKILLQALELLRDQKVDMIIHAGDIGDMCSEFAYETYLEVYNQVFPEENSRPVDLKVMGNHDTWFDTDWSTTPAKHKLYKKVFGVNPNRHIVVNGFHFIASSPDNTGNADGYSQTMKTWISDRLAKAKADTPAGNPIFLITHHNIPETVYGGSEWGAEQIRQAVTGYDQVVSISGHSHYSILDERSLTQNQLTAFTTQSLSYVDMERNMFNAFNGFYDDNGTEKFRPDSCYSSVPVNAAKNPMCVIMNVTEKDTTVERWDVLDKTEEKADRRWTLSYPLERGNFTYYNDARAAASEAPVFSSDASIVYNPSIASPTMKTALPGITFTAASHSDLVNSYTYELTNTQTQRTYRYHTYSDYYLGVEKMAKQVDWAIDPTLPSGNYTVKVYATESFGKRSEALTLNFDYQQPMLVIDK